MAARELLQDRRVLVEVVAGRRSSCSELPDLIRRFNESVGGVNSDSEGYHDTITRVFLHGVRLFLSEADTSEPLHELVNDLLLSPMGRRDWPLRFYSSDRLFSVAARRSFVPPDLAAFP